MISFFFLFVRPSKPLRLLTNQWDIFGQFPVNTKVSSFLNLFVHLMAHAKSKTSTETENPEKHPQVELPTSKNVTTFKQVEQVSLPFIPLFIETQLGLFLVERWGTQPNYCKSTQDTKHNKGELSNSQARKQTGPNEKLIKKDITFPNLSSVVNNFPFSFFLRLVFFSSSFLFSLRMTELELTKKKNKKHRKTFT